MKLSNKCFGRDRGLKVITTLFDTWVLCFNLYAHWVSFK